MMSLNTLVEKVKRSNVMLVLQTKDVLKRPWCVLEVYTAIKHQIPIVTVQIEGRGYDYEKTEHYLNNLDSLIDDGSRAVLVRNQCSDIIDVAYWLSSVIPHSLSRKYDPAATEDLFEGAIKSIAKAVRLVEFVSPTQSKDQWMRSRLPLR